VLADQQASTVAHRLKTSLSKPSAQRSCRDTETRGRFGERQAFGLGTAGYRALRRDDVAESRYSPHRRDLISSATD
jgi:hypothetical protein